VIDLPFIDAHSIDVDADSTTTWQAVLAVAERMASGRTSERFARAVGCEDTKPSGPRPLGEGSAIVGFHVATAEPERELALAGRHRFSNYALVFRLERLDAQRTRVAAETWAAFPGGRGRIYRTLVIGTRGHVLAVRRMLRAIEARAERAAPGRDRPA